MRHFIIVLFALAAFSFGASAQLDADGPYIFYNSDGTARIVSVDVGGVISDKVVPAPKAGDKFTVTEHDGAHSFEVTLHETCRPEWKRPAPEKMFIMSDPHGRLDCVLSLLQGNGVIDSDLHWSFGEGELFVIGDVMDRGKDVVQIYWLLYELEAEARAVGGRVSFVLGNHEPMVLSGDVRYTKKKYLELADSLGMEYRKMLGPDTELGQWLATRNAMEIVGDALFVHAGLGQDFLNRNLEIPYVNKTISRGLFMTKDERKADSEELYYMFKSLSPIWYRGLVLKDKKYFPADEIVLAYALTRYGVDRIYVGHTIFRDVKSRFGGRVVGVNVDNALNRAKGRGRAVLVEGGRLFVVTDDGRRLRELK